ncbi:MAG TPA: hypothetical protein DDW76_09630 [Cyanobacteria bacterium UBA11369]|nr:hypothetical protein [Cyanobacteria bacterium UBA11371]HBE34979.1 hypothetical protein [Cyanobacteria bacterium UBA11368]HBE49035.1 hypothetical protein [Cyanobacteria bacterium UBA11369]
MKWEKETQSDFYYPEPSSNLPSSKINSVNGNRPKIIAPSDSQGWRDAPLDVKFHEHRKSYFLTGTIDFMPIELVARMASEGKVFTPTQAELIIQQIEDSNAKIAKLVPQIHSELNYANSSHFQLDLVYSLLRQLNKDACVLLEVVKNNVLPFFLLANPEQAKKLQASLSDLSYATQYLLVRLHIDIAGVKSIGEHSLHRCMNYLQTMSYASQTLSEFAKQTILARVPFYQFSEEADTNV